MQSREAGRATRVPAPAWLLIAAVAAMGAAAAVVLAPSLGYQLAVVAAAVLAITCAMVSATGRVLNGAWIFALSVYLLDVGGVVLTSVHSPVPMIGVAALVPLPFILAALWLHPDTRRGLWRSLPLVALAGLAALSLVWSLDPSYGSSKLLLWLVTAGLPCVAMLVLVSPSRPVDWRVVAAFAVAYTFGVLLTGTESIYPGRLVAFEGNPIWVARAVFIGALVVLFGPFPRLVKVLLIPPMLIAGYLTDSQGPALGLLIGASIGMAETIRISALAPRWKGAAFAALGLLAAAGAVAILAVVGYASNSLTGALNDPNVVSRVDYLAIAARLFASNPIFGAGFGGFAAVGAADLYPHSMVAEVGSELGVLGLAIVVIWLVQAVRGALGSPLVLGLVAATATFALFSGNLAGNTEFWICTAVAVAMIRRSAPPARAIGPAP